MKPIIMHKQRGMTLIVALIMLVLITLLVATGINIEKGSLLAVGNMQQRNQVYAAAQDTIEEVISSTRFINTPQNAIIDPCDGGSPNTKCFSVTGSTGSDIKVTLATPSCIKSQRATLTLAKSGGSMDTQSLSAALGADSSDLSNDTPENFSAAWDTTWEVQANAVDSVTQASISLVQGVAVRVYQDAVVTSCP